MKQKIKAEVLEEYIEKRRGSKTEQPDELMDITISKTAKAIFDEILEEMNKAGVRIGTPHLQVKPYRKLKQKWCDEKCRC